MGRGGILFAGKAPARRQIQAHRQKRQAVFLGHVALVEGAGQIYQRQRRGPRRPGAGKPGAPQPVQPPYGHGKAHGLHHKDARPAVEPVAHRIHKKDQRALVVEQPGIGGDPFGPVLADGLEDGGVKPAVAGIQKAGGVGKPQHKRGRQHQNRQCGGGQPGDAGNVPVQKAPSFAACFLCGRHRPPACKNPLSG